MGRRKVLKSIGPDIVMKRRDWLCSWGICHFHHLRVLSNYLSTSVFDILDDDNWISEPTPIGMIWAKQTDLTQPDKIVTWSSQWSSSLIGTSARWSLRVLVSHDVLFPLVWRGRTMGQWAYGLEFFKSITSSSKGHVNVTILHKMPVITGYPKAVYHKTIHVQG